MCWKTLVTGLQTKLGGREIATVTATPPKRAAPEQHDGVAGLSITLGNPAMRNGRSRMAEEVG